MTDAAYQALRDAVNIARQLSICRVGALKMKLIQRGWPEQTVNEAMQIWANYERAKRT